MRIVPILLLAAALAGCGQKEITSADLPKPPDPYAGMSPQQKIEAIRSDQKMPDMEKHDKIVDAQKSAGLPVTGQ